MFDRDFDYINYLKRKGFIVARGYKLNPAFKVSDILDNLSSASGKTVTESELFKLIEITERNNNG